ncbi:hypothetical protein [Nostoc sp.]
MKFYTKDYEILSETTGTFVYVAMIRLNAQTTCVIKTTYQNFSDIL